MKVKAEYLWLDGYSTANVRSKTKIIDVDVIGRLAADLSIFPEC